MSTNQSTVDHILDQLSAHAGICARKMFGEYALYADGKVVGLVCDDTLYIKITEEGKVFVGEHYREGYAYKGAKVSMVIDEDRIDDREWLGRLIRVTVKHLPEQTKRVKKSV